MKKFYRIVAGSLVAPLLFFGILCCHFSGMACAQAFLCYSLISSATHKSPLSCDASGTKAKQCKTCDCFKISAAVDQNYSTAIPGKDGFVSGRFILSSVKAYYLIPRFSNYQSPPKIVQNSLPLYLQISVLRL
jgi:hypothetical protein